MLEKDNEKILKMIEDPDYLAKKVKAAVDKLNQIRISLSIFNLFNFLIIQ